LSYLFLVFLGETYETKSIFMNHTWELCVYVHAYVPLWDQQGRQHIRDVMREGGQVEDESSDQSSRNTKKVLWEMEGMREENRWRERESMGLDFTAVVVDLLF